MEDHSGKKFGVYDLIELIGKGGMATVYRGFQPSMNRNVAIKIMARQFSDNPLFVQRFKNEAQLIAALEHAHILPVYDFGEQDNTLYIVMRYLAAGDLSDRIVESETGLGLKDASAIFMQLASALDYAHSRGVIHRDLKPSNVMIDNQGNAFLTDFGIAKSLKDDQKLTATDSVVGTPTYMSPEQGLGEELDNRTDIYALGVILFEMLTGKIPFEGDNPMAVMLKHINEAPPAPSSFKPALTPDVDAVVRKAMAKSREDRYKTAMEMANDFQAGAAAALGMTPPRPQPTLTPSGAAAGATMPMNASPGAATLGAPIAGQPATETAYPGVAVPTIAGAPPTAPLAGAVIGGTMSPAAAVLVPSSEVVLTLNSASAWLKTNAWLGSWMQAAALSLVTFLMLIRLAPGSVPEAALLALVPGIVVYGLLRAPTVASLLAMVLVLVPLLAFTPGLAIFWFAMIVIAGSRLNSREIMLLMVGIVVAATPLGWLIPLLAPWWLRGRRVLLPAALSVFFATLFAMSLGWSDAGGLLPVPLDLTPFEALPLTIVYQGDIAIVPFSTSYIGLFNPDLWLGWAGDVGAVANNIIETGRLYGLYFADTHAILLVISTLWAVATTISVSNRRVAPAYLRAAGPIVALILLIIAHSAHGQEGVLTPNATALGVGVFAGALTLLLTQWPIQVDPNLGNQRGTILRMLRQSLGAFFLALGMTFFIGQMADAQFYIFMWTLGIIATLSMITNPISGPPLMAAALIIGSFQDRLGLTVAIGVLFVAYLAVNLIFDRRRPRHWNPLGAGILFGSPGMVATGIFPLGPMSIGALEAQVPAAILAALGHVLLFATADTINPIGAIIQIILTIGAVLTVERLMGTPLLSMIDNKIRRLIFSAPLALLLAVLYFSVTGLKPAGSLPMAVLVSTLAAAGLVFAMGDRAALWREFTEREEAEEEFIEDEEVTGATGQRRAAR